MYYASCLQISTFFPSYDHGSSHAVPEQHHQYSRIQIPSRNTRDSMGAAGCGCTIARCPAMIQTNMGQGGGVALVGLRARAHHALPKTTLLRDIRNTPIDGLERALPPQGKERAAVASGRILPLVRAGHGIRFWGACVTGWLREGPQTPSYGRTRGICCTVVLIESSSGSTSNAT